MPLTPDQELGCESRGGSRLVSAAAGSGKTRVLVERLMRYVDRGTDIDEFLVVTYTRAAAGELRSRILEALRLRIAENPSDRRLRRQTELCCRAAIGTIDSICARFLRENAHLRSLPPDFQVMEQDRSEELRARVLDQVMDALYEHLEEDAAMRALVDSFGHGRDDQRLTELVLGLHASLQSHPDPADWMDRQRRSLCPEPGTDAGDTPWGAYLLRRCAAQAGYWAGQMEELLSLMAAPEQEKLRSAYAGSIAETAEALRALERSAARGWESARAALPIPFPRAKSFPKGDPDGERVKAVREEAKKAMASLASSFSDDSETLMEELRSAAPAMDALLRLTGALEDAYQAEKKRRGVLDFSDLEHQMLSLLESESDLRESLSSRYAEVLVDEYQDVNACQDRLFTLLSDNGRKLFTVGDVKQSIYRFRLADPTIFLKKYDAYPPVTDALVPGAPGRILLRENFRSRREVIDAVNHVFSNIMSRELGELDYDADAALRPGRELPPGGGAPAELTILSLPAEEGEENERRPDKIALEAAYVAARIRALVDAHTMVTEGDGLREANYGDFAILLRSHKAVTGRYRAALLEQGIPSVSQQGGGFFRSLEVSMLLSFLAVIDNPRQDVALIATLRSPLFGFTADDLSAIRAADRDGDFYTALTRAAETEERFAAFLRQLELWRSLGTDLSVEALLSRIADDTDLFALLSAMPDGAARRENVQLLMDYAREFELSGYRGIFRFIEWIRAMEEQGREPRTGAVERREAVQIISIHHSKGLEYPIVFLANTSRRFNDQDLRSPVLIHPTLGVGGKVVDSARGIQYPSLAWRAIAQKRKEESLSEEMRVLYVAMTRAKDRLYISCLVPDGEKTLEKLSLGLRSPLPSELLRRDSSAANWLIRAALLPGSPLHLRTEIAADAAAALSTETLPAEEETAPADSPALSLDWQYPRSWAVSLPSKITASALEGRDEPDTDGEDRAPEHRLPRSPRRPEFGREDAPLTGAARGIAAHTLMQYIDFSRTGSREAVAGELERLRAEGRLSDKQAAAVDPSAIFAFFRSPLGQRVLRADQVWRELRFSLLCGAEEFFPVPPGEQLLLQGVVDCCIREGEALTVIDYKTDFVTPSTLAEKTAEYAPQLRSYASALRRILGYPVREAALFFLRSGDWAAVPLE